MIALLILLPSLTRIWIGTDEYDEYIVYGQLLVSAFAIKSITTITGGSLYVNGQTRPIIRVDLIGSFINISVSVILVQVLGIGGILIGTILPLLVTAPYLFHLARPFFEIDPPLTNRENEFRPLLLRLIKNVGFIALAVTASAYVEREWTYEVLGINAASAALAAVVLLTAFAVAREPVARTISELKAL